MKVYLQPSWETSEPLCRVTTCPKNREMSGNNLTAVRKMSGQLTKSQGYVGEKSCQGKLFHVNFTFWATLMLVAYQ